MQNLDLFQLFYCSTLIEKKIEAMKTLFHVFRLVKSRYQP